MTDKPVWSRYMTDDEFVDASLPYFKQKYLDLHIGCCLIACVDPQTKVEPVGLGYTEWREDEDQDGEYDYTRRPFLVALRAIKIKADNEIRLYGIKPLPSIIKNEPIQSGKDVEVDTRIFVKWVIAQWPDNSRNFRKAEQSYQERKANSPAGYLSQKPTKAQYAREKQYDAYQKLVEKMGGKTKHPSDRKMAKILAAEIKDTEYSAKPETLRKRIPVWRKLSK